MADNLTTVTVPGVGDVDFPAEMSHDDIAHAIQVNYFPNREAQQHASQEMDKFLTPPTAHVPITAGLLPSFKPTPTATSRTSQAYRSRFGQSAETEFDPSATLFNPRASFGLAPIKTAQETPNPLNDTAMSSTERAQLRGQLARHAGGMAPSAAQTSGRAKLAAANQAVGGTANDEAPSAAIGSEYAERPYLYDALAAMARGADMGNVSAEDMRSAMEKSVTPFRGAPGTLTPPDSKGLEAAKGAMGALLHTTAGLTTPENAALMAGMVAAPETAAAKAADVVFAGQMGVQGAEQSFKGIQDLRKGKIAEGVEAITSGGLGFGLGSLATLHMGVDTYAGKLADEQIAQLEREGKTTPVEQHVAQAQTGQPVETKEPERRKDRSYREQVANMSDEEFDRTFLKSQKAPSTGNLRAFQIAEDKEPAKAFAVSDLDGLKAVNDKYGHAAGDALIAAKGDALKEAGVDAYHVSGDEFVSRGSSRYDLDAKMEKAREILQNKDIKVTQPDGSIVHLKGVDFTHGVGDKFEVADAAQNAAKDAKAAAGQRARGQFMGKVTTEPAPAVLPEPVTEGIPTQAQNPSVETPTPKPSVEPDMRQRIGSMLRIRQLQTAAKDRLAVQTALKDHRADLPIPLETLDAVSRALGVPADSLRDTNYHLSGEQAARLVSMLKTGKKATDLDSEHVEFPFAPKGVAPLAEINEENLRAAGVPSPKDRFALLTKAERQRLTDFKGKTQSRGLGPEEGVTGVGAREARQTGQVSSGRDIDTLQMEHDLAQLGLERRYKNARDELKGLIPQWMEERKSATGPSELSQDIAGLAGRARGIVPKELYATEHLTKGAKTPESPLAPKPTAAAKAPEAKPAAEGTASEKLEGPELVQRITQLAEAIQDNHGDEAFNGLGVIFQAAQDRYKSPGAVNQAIYATVRRYEANLRKGVDGPLKDALDNVLAKFPENPEATTLYANPILPILKKLFGGRQTPVAKANMPGPVKFPESPLDKFTQTLEQHPEPSTRDSATAFLRNELGEIQQTIQATPKFTSDTFARLQDLSKKAWDAYKTRPGLNPLEWALGWRRLQLTTDALVAQRFADKIHKLHPEIARREAMVNYLQAGGGVLPEQSVLADLKFKENSFANRLDNRKLKQGYLDAQSLSPEEKQTIQEYRAYDAFMRKQEQAQGLELHAHENYIRQIWDENSIAARSASGVFHAGSFSTTAPFMKMRKYETYFEGEMDGLVPHRKDFGYLVSARARASAQVIANKALVENLYQSTMPDGSKMAQVAGVGVPEGMQPNPSPADAKGAILVKGGAVPSQAVTLDGRPYATINHPAFANWKWVGAAEDGTTVMYRGSMLVHPDLKAQIDRILQPSALRQNPVGRAVLKASSIGKQTLLVGLFHPVQLGIHFLEHAAEGGTTGQAMKALNPYSKPVIDLTKTDQQMLVIHGLKIADFNAESMWDEGVMSRGMANGFPVVGKFLSTIHDAMFQRYIPNLKMAMAQDALQRNIGRYHDQYQAEELKKPGGLGYQNPKAASIQAQSRIYRMTAEQMNAAFGGINWDSLPVSRTMQDVMRLTVLAPDFLLARMQFVGDALRPGGMESRKALLVGAAIQYVAARAFNSAMNDGDAKRDVHDWNKLVVGHHEYSLRTVQGDLMDSILDPRKFISHRANPITLRPIIEAATGKDVFGHPASAGQQLYDFAKNVVPMPLQGIMDGFGAKINHNLRQGKTDETIADTILQSFGIQRKQYRSPSERFVYETFDNIKGNPSTDELAMEQKNTFKYLRDEFRQGKLKPSMLQDALDKGTLKGSEIQYLYRTRNETRLVTETRQLQPMEALKAWSMGTEAEKMELVPLMFGKLSKLPPDKIGPIAEKLSNFVDGLTDAQQEKIHAKIADEIEYENPTPPEQEEDKTGEEPQQ